MGVLKTKWNYSKKLLSTKEVAMMNAVTVFNNEAFGALRTIERDGEIWFTVTISCVPKLSTQVNNEQKY